jgi:hypothetical protein
VQKIIDASLCGHLTFLVTEFGKPFTAKGFDSKFRTWCDEAELPHCNPWRGFDFYAAEELQPKPRKARTSGAGWSCKKLSMRACAATRRSWSLNSANHLRRKDSAQSSAPAATKPSFLTALHMGLEKQAP